MTLKQYFRFVKIHTSTLSLFGYGLGAAIIYLLNGNWNWQNSLIFFVASMIFDNMITGVNTVMDYVMAKDERFKEISVMTVENISVKQAFSVIGLMVTLGAGLGLWLCFRTNWMLFFLGGAMFLIFAFYTSGPFPISRMPLGEAFSGTAQGLGIPFLFVFVNDNYNRLLALNFTPAANGYNFSITGNLRDLITVVLICVPAWLYTSNVMLADNLSDRVLDEANGRHTLPVVFGAKKALLLYQTLAYLPYLFIAAAALLHITPYLSLLSLLTFPLIRKNVETFRKRQVKSETFVTALQNFQIVTTAQIITIALGGWLKF